MYFPVAGIELNPLIPVLVGFTAALIFGQVGLTGSIAVLPFMISFLNFTSPSVTSTNLIYNITTPLGSIYSYQRERRIVWRIGVFAGLGGVLGSLIGPRIRIWFLADILVFRLFLGILLAVAGIRLFLKKPAHIGVGRVEGSRASLFKAGFVFSKNTYDYSPVLVFIAGLFVGTISTTFGIGTGFFLVPFYTTLLALPIYAVAGSALLSTMIISTAGTIVYLTIDNSTLASPDIALGLLFGFGGIMGGYLSPKMQKHIHVKVLHRVLGAILFIWAVTYLL